jgi:hypothetical protein
MKRIIVCTGIVLAAGSLMAQEVNYYIAKQQAKRDSAQNDAEQQRIAREAGGQQNGPGGPAAPANPAPMDPALQATLKNVNSLQTDFASAINSTGGAPDPGQKVALLNDLTQAAQGTSKASSASVKKVADDLVTALAGQKKLTAAQQTKMAREIHALFNSSHLSATQQDTLLNDIQKTLTDAGVSLDAAVNLVTDLKQVVTETK